MIDGGKFPGDVTGPSGPAVKGSGCSDVTLQAGEERVEHQSAGDGSVCGG